MALQMTTIFGSALAERVALEPLLTAPLLYLFSQQPQLFRDHVLKRFPKLASSTTITILKWLVALGLGKRLSQIVGSLALNNWQVMPSRSNWDWPNEIAVVTGGCSGFGELVAQGLAKKGVKVVILDIQDLPKSLQDSTSHSMHGYKEEEEDLSNDIQTRKSPSTNATSPTPAQSQKSQPRSGQTKATHPSSSTMPASQSARPS